MVCEIINGGTGFALLAARSPLVIFFIEDIICKEKVSTFSFWRRKNE